MCWIVAQVSRNILFARRKQSGASLSSSAHVDWFYIVLQMTALPWPSLGFWRFFKNNWQKLEKHPLRHICSAMEHKFPATNVFLVLRWCGPGVCALQIRWWTALLRIWRTRIIVDKSTLSLQNACTKNVATFGAWTSRKYLECVVLFRSKEIFLNAACTGSPLARVWSTYSATPGDMIRILLL